MVLDGCFDVWVIGVGVSLEDFDDGFRVTHFKEAIELSFSEVEDGEEFVGRRVESFDENPTKNIGAVGGTESVLFSACVEEPASEGEVLFAGGDFLDFFPWVEGDVFALGGLFYGVSGSFGG